MNGIEGFGALIIGDEIMRGKRRDVHFDKLREVFAARGLKLDWVQFLGDDRALLIKTLQRTLAGKDVVFSFGGIGATPDDHTRQAAAAAAGVPLVLHPEAAQLIRERMAETGQELSEGRLNMGVFPEGSRIVPNTFNRIPGFSYAHHHFFPGFPVMAHPMLEWCLETYYADRFNSLVEAEAAMRVWDGIEGTMTPLMQEAEVRFPGIKVFSLPFVGSAELKRHVELGVRGEPSQVAPAMDMLRAGVAALGYRFDDLPGDTTK
ncbi:MAG: competence/damage-inducible protein A [Rhodocyclaceae bacterium]|nr:competence/damage-inducible protein A [Rhodocyclaceae bacterium]